MSVRRGASQLLPARSIHLRIVPRPTNLSESREIFRVLQRFGEVSVFKYLRHEYHNPADNIALAIFRDPTAAQKALDASPIRFALERVLTHPDEYDSSQSQHGSEEHDDDEHSTPDSHNPEIPTKDGIDEMLRPSSLLTRTSPPTPPPGSNPPSTTPMPFDPPPTQPTRTKWFQVTVDRSRAVHQDYVERQPYWKQFHPMKSMAQEDLAKQVPHIGLSDVSKRPLHQHRTPTKVLRQMSEYVENVMPSLRGMAENDAVERRFSERRNKKRR